MKHRKHLKAIVKIAGSQSNVARRLSEITGRPYRQGHVWNWLNRDAEIPAEAVLALEQIAEGKVSRTDLRPDIYPASDYAA